MAIRVGIGSWGDDAYVGVLYPPGLPKRERLRDYTRTFSHIEVNSTYYSTPPAATFRSWLKQTPEGFTFTLKLHRAFSQSPNKAAQGPLLRQLLTAAQPLLEANRVPVFLLVLPPRFGPDRHRLEELDGLAERLAPHPLAVELRDRAWVTGTRRDATLVYYRARGLVWVAVDMPRVAGSALMPPVDEVTHPGVAYVRLHGRNPNYLEAKTAAEGHHYAYTERDVARLATRIRKLARGAPDVFVIANNHAEDFAPKAALALKRALERRKGASAR